MLRARPRWAGFGSILSPAAARLWSAALPGGDAGAPERCGSRCGRRRPIRRNWRQRRTRCGNRGRRRRGSRRRPTRRGAQRRSLLLNLGAAMRSCTAIVEKWGRHDKTGVAGAPGALSGSLRTTAAPSTASRSAAPARGPGGGPTPAAFRRADRTPKMGCRSGPLLGSAWGFRRRSGLGGDVLFWLSGCQSGDPCDRRQPHQRQHRQSHAAMPSDAESHSAAGVPPGASPSGARIEDSGGE